MARPSKLTSDQWDTITKRLMAGEKASDLAREYGVSKTAVSVRVSKRTEALKDVANQLVSAETKLRALPVSEQVMVLTLADELRAISTHLAGAAKFGAATAHRLAGIANGIVDQIDDAEPLKSMEQIKAVHALSDTANKTAHIALNLLAANKGNIPLEPPRPAGVLPADVQDAAIEYAKLMG